MLLAKSRISAPVNGCNRDSSVGFPPPSTLLQRGTGHHCAAWYKGKWAWFQTLLGAVQTEHTENQTATVKVRKKDHESTRHLPDNWVRPIDEFHNFANMRWDSVTVLATVDEGTYQGGTHGDFHPVSWYRPFMKLSVFFERQPIFKN